MTVQLAFVLSVFAFCASHITFFKYMFVHHPVTRYREECGLACLRCKARSLLYYTLFTGEGVHKLPCKLTQLCEKLGGSYFDYTRAILININYMPLIRLTFRKNIIYIQL